MKTISLRIPNSLDRRISRQAKKLHVSKSQLVRDALEWYLEYTRKLGGPSCYDLTRDLCGSVEGPPDLSTNRKYLEGFGQ